MPDDKDSKSKEFVEYLESMKPEIDEVIEKYFPRRANEKWLEFTFGKPHYAYNLDAAQESLIKPVWDFIDRGGKRWRPILFLLISEAIDGVDWEKIKDIVIIPELIHNGCLPEDTSILKNPGEQVKITEIKKGDYVYTLTPEGKLGREKVVGLKSSGVKKVYKLKTRNREIEASGNHPFLVITKNQPIRYKITSKGRAKIDEKLQREDIKEINGFLKRGLRVLYNGLYPDQPQLLEKEELEFVFNFLGSELEKSDYITKQTKFESPEVKLSWKKLEDIKEGDWIIILNKLPDKGKPKKIPIPPKDPVKDETKIPKYTTKEFCQLIGYILGDGSISINKKSSRLILCPPNDEEEILAYTSLFSKVFSYNLKRYRAKEANYLYCCSFKVCWVLDKLGLHKKATEKTVPEWIFSLPREQKLAFIRGYLDSDGWVQKNGETGFASANKNLIKKLKLLLDSLGFTTSHIYHRKVKNLWEVSKKKYSDMWSISLSDPNYVLENIGTEKSIYRKRLQKERNGMKLRFSHEFPWLPLDFPCFRVDPVVEKKPGGRKPVYDLMIENSHNFIANNIVAHNSIIVDDIEDLGELRRGKPCLHKIFGVDIAVNAGNFLYFFPLLALIKNKKKFAPDVITRAYEAYAQEMINLGFGQGTDIYWHRGQAKEIKEEEYLQMCAFKTGCLSRMSAKLAVILSGGSDELSEAAGRVAEAIGVAFQIQDDILDIISEGEEREKFGKVFGNDIKEGKRTLMVIRALEKATEEDKKRLIEILNKHTDDMEERKEAIEIIKKYGSVEYAQEKAKEIMKKAWEEADKLLPETQAKKRLEQFVNFLITRKL